MRDKFHAITFLKKFAKWKNSENGEYVNCRLIDLLIEFSPQNSNNARYRYKLFEKKFAKWKTRKKVNMWITDLIGFFRKTVITRGINFFPLTVQSSLITRTWTEIIFHKMKKLNEKILKFFLIFWFFYPFTLVKFVKMENSKSVKWKLKKCCENFMK